jgi:hypothetical protein
MLATIFGVIIAIAIVYAILDAFGLADIIWEVVGVVVIGYLVSLGIGTLADWLGGSYELFQKGSYVLLAISLLKRVFHAIFG